MRKWQNLAAPDDPGSWYDVDGVYPTKRGTYRRVEFGEGTETAASGAGTVLYAFAAGRLAGVSEYIVDSAKIWEYVSSFTDRTGGVTIGTYPMMAMYGNVAICVMGAGNPTVKATAAGGSFSALAGAPQGEIVVVQSNAVLILNTNTAVDGWAASDVGDYTNWTTGESASGRLIATPGPIMAAVAFGDSVIVFKSSSVYRMRYVGGAVKWTTELLHSGVGCSLTGYPSTTVTYEKYSACASPAGILFLGPGDIASGLSAAWWMDGAAQFREVNKLTEIGAGYSAFIRYNPDNDVFALWSTGVRRVWFYCPSSDAWGYSLTPNSAAGTPRPTMGNTEGLADNRYALPISYYKANANTLTRYVPNPNATGACYLQTSMFGTVDRKTKFDRCTPILRRRGDLGSDVAALSATYFRELHDTSAQRTEAVTESGYRKRFDLNGVTENFARFKVTFTDLLVEVDDFAIKAKDGGEN